MLIADLVHSHGTTFSGEYRIRSLMLGTSRSGAPYASFELGDMTGSLKSYLWIDADYGPPNLTEMDHVSVSARLECLDGKCVGLVNSIQTIKDYGAHPVELIPAWQCPLICLMPYLHQTVMVIESKPLRNFLVSIFDDDSIALPFVALPASRVNHHSYAGGLLEHSLECAEIIICMPQFSCETRELGVVAALMHDVGKIRTLSNASKLSHAGFLLNHEALTLEVLNPHLQKLDHEWSDGALALRYLLTWKNHTFRQFPLMTIAEAVLAADRISAGLSRELSDFSALPLWRNATKSLFKDGFWRPQPYQEDHGNRR
ncbi:TraI domain-containing protein [Geobacter pelophilus]|uniref:TraI domain-containing protein n=1 Tax=Geoanaerobacter pelophilus TaxID=60036 RepID=A0AAW4LGC9_9BACT|nr:TraI domain-containing protein [Geoanaerobacter pelophilus]MBT0666221.1 TraI domain-containing protein [Geoanaerobacter pelophilus]